MVRHGTLDSLMKSLSYLTLSNAILASRAAGSWGKYCCTVTLCEAVIVCCIAKTALTSVTLLKPNCSYILMIMSYKT